MEFSNEMQKNVYAMLANWLAADIKAGTIQAADARPVFMARHGSTIMYVSVGALGDGEAAITVGANVVAGAQITPELMAHLLTYNNGSLFGAFGINPKDGTITFDHSIIGSTCDQKELGTSMAYVSATADRLDDELIAKFGGKSAIAIATGQ